MEALEAGLPKLNRSDPSVSYGKNDKGQLILSTCGEIHLQRCLKDLLDDYAPGVKIEFSDPIIPFRETIINKRLTNRVVLDKEADYEEITSSDESEDEATKLETATQNRKEMTVGELIDYEDRLELFNKQLNIEKELLKKEQALDPYLEKLVDIKLQQGNEQLTRRQQAERGMAKGGVGGKCQLKVRAVGLHFEVTRWLEGQTPYLRGFSNLA